MSDMVNHPPHYTSHPSGVECIQITEHMGFCIGNAVKYLWRSQLKHSNQVIDLEKAIWYIQREIKKIEVQNGMENLPARHPLRGEQERECPNDRKDK